MIIRTTSTLVVSFYQILAISKVLLIDVSPSHRRNGSSCSDACAGSMLHTRVENTHCLAVLGAIGVHSLQNHDLDATIQQDIYLHRR